MKIPEFQIYLGENSIGYAILYNIKNPMLKPNFFYFSQYDGEAAMIIPKLGAAKLILTQLESSHQKHTVWKKGRFFEFIKKQMRQKASKIGVDKDNLTINAIRKIKQSFPRTRLVSITDACLELRKNKTEQELENIQRACKISEQILQECVGRFNKFKTETEVMNFLKTRAIEEDSEAAFEPVVACGSNAAIPHHKSALTKIKNGFVILDFGVRFRGYCADLTRTIFVGRPSRQDVSQFEQVRDTQNEVIDLIKPKTSAQSLQEFAQKRLGKALIHAIGHGVGIEVHEQPALTENNKAQLEEGMILSIEPGFYVPKKFGIRIEDMVQVTRHRARIISKQQELITV